MDKKELRSTIKSLKRQHSDDELNQQSAVITHKLETEPIFVKAQTIMLYNALPDEVQTKELIARWRDTKTIVLPTVEGDDIIPVALNSDTDFAIGDFNILEPQNEPYIGTFDLIVVPGVAFDTKGNRMGRGRGYYDRFLAKHQHVNKIGICFDFQLVDNIPTEPHDIKMDFVISY